MMVVVLVVTPPLDLEKVGHTKFDLIIKENRKISASSSIKMAFPLEVEGVELIAVIMVEEFCTNWLYGEKL